MNAHSNPHWKQIRKNLFPATIVVCALVLAAVCGCSPAQRYRQQHDAKSLFAVLHNQIKSGDSIARVQELLGPGQPPPDAQKMLNATRRFAERSPQDYPGGVKDDDTFIGFDGYSGGQIINPYLQFRNGWLINFNPQNYAEVPNLSVREAASGPAQD